MLTTFAQIDGAAIPPMTMPPVRAILLNYNRPADTVTCLESLLELDYPNFRVVLCDNGSTDDSLEQFRTWTAERGVATAWLDRNEAESGTNCPQEPLVVIRNGANLGFTGGNNVGLRFVQRTMSTGYAWLLNNDMVVATNCLRRMVETAEADSRLAAVGATIYEFDAPHVVQEAGGGRLIGSHARVRPNDAGATRTDPVGRERLDYISGGCMLVRRHILDEIGLLDERFFIYLEDVDWCFRMTARGYRIGYCRDAEVRHKESATTGQGSPFKDFHIVRSVFIFGAKHAPAAHARTMAHALYRFVLPKIARAQWKRLAAVGRGYLAYRREMATGR
jgi:GT2 family glycosyltransferase